MSVAQIARITPKGANMSEKTETKTVAATKEAKRNTSLSLPEALFAKLDDHSFTLRKRGISPAIEAIVEAHLAGVESGKIVVAKDGAISFA